MAIVNVKEKVTLKLELDGGLVDGKQKTVSKSLSKVKTDALDEDLHGTAAALAALQSKALLNVKRIEESKIVNE